MKPSGHVINERNKSLFEVYSGFVAHSDMGNVRGLFQRPLSDVGDMHDGVQQSA